MDSDEIAKKFSPPVITLTMTAYITGMMHFDGHRFQQGLAGVFCHALRFALLDELEGTEQTAVALLKDVVDHIAPGTPQEILDALKSLSPDKFDENYKILRIKAGEEGIDIAEFAEALKHAKEIASYVAQQKGK